VYHFQGLVSGEIEEGKEKNLWKDIRKGGAKKEII
jgi:hypothetical protein